MMIIVHFYSYFKDVAGCAQTTHELGDGATLGELHEALIARFPELGKMRRATLMAVGVHYQKGDCVLKPGDVVSFFPPVQGG